MFTDAPAVLREAGLYGAAARTERCLDAGHRAKCKVRAPDICERCRRGHSEDYLVLRCDGHGGGGRHVQCVGVHCGHRVCAECAPRRRARLVKEYDYDEGVQAFKAPVLVTLTVANLTDLWREDLLRLKAAFGDLRRRVVWKGHDCHAACVKWSKGELKERAREKSRGRELLHAERACEHRGGTHKCRSICVGCPRRAEHDRCACGCVGRRRHDCTDICEACPRVKMHGMWQARECGHIYQTIRGWRKDNTPIMSPARRCRCPGEHPGVPGGLMSLEITATEHDWGCPGRPATKQVRCACGCVGRRRHDCGDACEACPRKGHHGRVLKRGQVEGPCKGGCVPSWHPHLHVVADLGRWISIQAIGEAWAACARRRGFRVGDFPADVGAIKAGFARKRGNGQAAHARARTMSQALTYAVKYASKGDLPQLEARRDGEEEREYLEREARHRRRFAAVYVRAIENLRLVQPFGKLRARRYHAPGVLPACLDCCELLEKRDYDELDHRVKPLEPDADAPDTSGEGTIFPSRAAASDVAGDASPAPASCTCGIDGDIASARNCPACLAPPTERNPVRPVERIRRHLAAFVKAWPSLLPAVPRERRQKRAWIASYLRTVYGIPISLWTSEGLFSGLAGRVSSGHFDGLDESLFSWVTGRLDAAGLGPPPRPFPSSPAIPSWDELRAEDVAEGARRVRPSIPDPALFDPALDESCHRPALMLN